MFRSIADDLMSLVRILGSAEKTLLPHELNDTDSNFISPLSVDGFKEITDCQLFSDILLKDYKKLVQRISSRYNLPNDVRQALVRNAKHDTKLIKDFRLRFGKEGKLAYGIVATQKYKKTVDLAFSIYSLEMEISSSDGGEVAGKLLTSKITPLDDHFNADWVNYYQRKALEAFDKEYPGITILRK